MITCKYIVARACLRTRGVNALHNDISALTFQTIELHVDLYSACEIQVYVEFVELVHTLGSVLCVFGDIAVYSDA